MEPKISVCNYTKNYRNEWDNHILKSKNSHFFFLRDFIEYHHHRFTEHSLIIKRGKKIAAVLPGNIYKDTFYSYQGLTYGGLIVDDKIRTANTGEIIDKVIDYLKGLGVTKLIYKKMPLIYNKMPYEEDIYHLIRCGAIIYSGEIGEVVDYSNFKTSSRRADKIKKAESEGIKIAEQKNYSKFWEILNVNLKKDHSAAPTHSLDEIEYLARKFPQNIKLFTATKSDKILCGTVLFLNNEVAHTQYIGSADEGHEYNALDFLLNGMLEKFRSKRYFSFGICTEKNGEYLNEGLAFFKESFGARGVVNLTFELTI